MTKKSYDELERLDQLALVPTEEPTEPTPVEIELQEKGDDPNTPVQDLTIGELTEALKAEGKAIKNTQASDEVLRQRDYHDLRNEYIPKLYQLIVVWLVFVALCVIASGLGFMKLSDAVLIAFITTTTATVISLFVIVAKWLFPSKEEKISKKEK